jgi:hypothetical protein
MKKYSFLLITCFTFGITQSQNITDALRYSQENINGTARFRAMSGAFGALGGDLSAININPAGSAVFSNNQISITTNNLNTNNGSTYFDTKSSDSKNSFNLINQGGAVFVFKNYDKKNDWKKFAVSLNYENNSNLDNSIIYSGINPTNSIDRYFLSYANANPNTGVPGIPLKLFNKDYGDLNFEDQQAYLGYKAYIIDPVDKTNENNTQYISNIPSSGNYEHRNSTRSKGNNGKFSINVATQYQEKFYFGINLNTYFTDFRQSSNFIEKNKAPLGNNYVISSVDFHNDLYTYGSGFSIQLGAIAKITKEFRLGLAYESPTWYRLNDELSQSITSESSRIADKIKDVVDPKIVNAYEPYNLQTPSKLTGSFAYVFGKTGLLSIDYSIKNYSGTKFSNNSNENSYMGQTLRDRAGELHIGGEYKIKQWSLRGGYLLEQSAYKDRKKMSDLTGYSGGLGYNFGSTKLDLAFSHSQREYQQQFFTHGFTDGAMINTNLNTITLTMVFEF